ncbi:MAG: glycosyltransferase [Planctomycetota bacterium]|nr:glycosyltransferase [Planctomycetota bacterium]
MKLLVLTQVLDRQDGVLGFFSRWIVEFARHCESVRVVALEVGDTSDQPDNVDWVEIGRRGVVGRYLKYRRTLARSLGTGPDGGFDVVLAHMVPRYALVAAAPARRANARLFLWYTHKGVDARLRRAVTLVEKTFSASEESLRVDTPTRVITGHGIDTDHFDLPASDYTGTTVLLSVGRLTPAKDPMTVIRAVGLLRAQGRDVVLDWVGGGLTGSDVGFADEVRALIAELDLAGSINLLGEIPYAQVDERFAASDLLVNASFTGSVDKVVLEAMAARRPALSCNDSFPVIFAELGDERAGDLVFPKGDAEVLAERVATWLDRGPDELRRVGEDLRAIVVRDHGVEALCERLCKEMGA